MGLTQPETAPAQSSIALPQSGARSQSVARKRSSQWDMLERSLRRHWQLYLIMVPALLYFFVFRYIPMVERRDRLQGLQRRQRHLGQPMGRIQALRAVFQQSGVLDTAQEYAGPEPLRVGRGVSHPDHPGICLNEVREGSSNDRCSWSLMPRISSRPWSWSR